MRTIMLAAAAAFFMLPASADARQHKFGFQEFCGDHYCSTAFHQVRQPRARASRKAASHKTARHSRKIAKRIQPPIPARREASYEAQIVAHPEGCPARSFCGCGTALKIFGRNIRAAWLAAWWFRFPESTPGPGKIAVRRHHVFAILKDLGNGRVLAYDPNSGGHRTRIHVRSLAGYSVRDPKAATAAASYL